MLGFISGSGLSVRQRLMTLGAATSLGIGSMLAVGWYENAQVDTALTRALALQRDVEQLNEMQLASSRLVLAAMDTIIDRGEGVIQKERAEIIRSAATLLSAGAPIMKSLAQETGNAALAETYDADVAEIVKAIEVDLKRLVETGAPEADYAAIDDAIDGAGDRLSATLDQSAALAGQIMQASVEGATARAGASLYIQLGLGLLALCTTLLLQAVHGNAIVNGIRAVRSAMQRVLDGDLETAVQANDRRDEIGEMARSVDVFRNAAVEKRALESSSAEASQRNEQEREARAAAIAADNAAVKRAVDQLALGLNRLSEGDLSVTIAEAFPGDLERLRADFNQTTNRLQSVMGEIASNSSSIRANGLQMRSAADDLARRTEQQAASLEETSAALDEITATVRNATERAEEASHMVDNAKVYAERSGSVVSDAMAAMERIEDATGEIGKIINVVDEIAFQTNLLALNAGVEAARAGEAGKGFAVVAQEVRALAGRAAEAARDIKTLVGRSSAEVKTGVELVTAAGEALHRIGEDVLRINEHVKSIVTSAREQSVGLSEINSAVGQMDQVTQQNAAMVEQTNAASHTLAGDAENLSRLVGQFKMTGSAYAAPVQPQAASAASLPKPSPAKSLIDKVAGTFNRSAVARVASQGAAAENWEEF
ncbi:MAG: methyl-accepting chemotaxis protein [Alphaproteobacteria bacterium]|nr:methyl-accepting chemotaxis protein [Rhizobiaceae bacterium]MBU3963931.1 methyl-accepting chemotaxis protein [Alphaproteobacteria bacterium]MBU4049929.1 methyl-accepting chemotaxis protein [Alphaproteobacteria bacterium]MBU4090831.1 methyl-accepting chemotaxis protein [Alphaproteobacteria bacterium]MBU4155236.1 methyl-accepting chemotaxis protein [Alphaproteobacteria bacterium]